jgi:hypothetical protein
VHMPPLTSNRGSGNARNLAVGSTVRIGPQSPDRSQIQAKGQDRGVKGFKPRRKDRPRDRRTLFELHAGAARVRPFVRRHLLREFDDPYPRVVPERRQALEQRPIAAIQEIDLFLDQRQHLPELHVRQPE